VGQNIRIEIRGRDGFWRQAFNVEWSDRFPDRILVADASGCFLVDPDWFEDIKRVASQVFCEVRRAPDNPMRRRWISSLIKERDD
jgi:hypothetical protein